MQGTKSDDRLTHLAQMAPPVEADEYVPPQLIKIGPAGRFLQGNQGHNYDVGNPSSRRFANKTTRKVSIKKKTRPQKTPSKVKTKKPKDK
jgi:hypothetical protein